MTGKDICIALFSVLLLSLNIVSSKMGIEHFPPFLFTTLRFLSVLPLLYFFPIRAISLRNLALISLCWGVLYLGCINLALFFGVSAGVCILVIQSNVFVTMLLSIFFLKKWPTLPQVLGAIVGFLGVSLICLITNLTASGIGLLLLIVASISFSIGMLLVKRCNSDPFALNVWISLLSAVPMSFLSLVVEDNIFEILASATLLQWGTVLFAGWVSMLLAGASWTYIVKKYDLNLVAPFRLVVPIFGVIFATLILGEKYPMLTWVGAGIVTGGLILTQGDSLYKLFFNLQQRNRRDHTHENIFKTSIPREKKQRGLCDHRTPLRR